MTHKQAESELMQIYMSLSEEKKKAIDTLIKASRGTMLNCPSCGLEIHSDFSECPRCGEQLQTCGTCRNEDTYHCAECENKSDYEQAQLQAHVIQSALDNGTNTVIATAQADENLTTALCSLHKIQSSDGQDYVQLYDVLETVRGYLGDCISKTEAIKTIQQHRVGCFDADDFTSEQCERYVIKLLQDLKPSVAIPSVNPQEPKTGHWKRISIDKYSEHAKYWYRCDRCGKDNLGNTDWCPNCGAKMVEPQESEDKE